MNGLLSSVTDWVVRFGYGVAIAVAVYALAELASRPVRKRVR